MKKQKNMKYIALFLSATTFLCSIIIIICFGNNIKDNNKLVNSKEQIINTKNKSIVQLSETDIIETNTVKISFVGDLMVHQPQLDNSYMKETKLHDFEKVFEPIKPYLEKSDFTIGNLETVFGGSEIGYTDYPRFNSPDRFGLALKNAGFDLLTTANNHSNDKDEEGILRTINLLEYLEIDNVGTYSNQNKRDNIYIKQINNITFAFLSYTYGTNGIAVPKGKEYLINIMSEKLIKSDIEKAKLLNPDFIIVMPHMGNEYEDYPKDVFKKWVNFILNEGADVVIASHPHVLQPVEFIEMENEARNCFVAYSMANFISSQRTKPRESGLILNLSFEKTTNEKPFLKSVSYVPTWVKFVNKAGIAQIQVIPVIETIKNYNAGTLVDLRQKDINRVIEVYKETTNIISGNTVSISDVKDEIVIYNIIKN